jgi:hypothetical protein
VAAVTPYSMWLARRALWAREWEKAHPKPVLGPREDVALFRARRAAWSKARDLAAELRDREDPRPALTPKEAENQRQIEILHGIITGSA